MTDLGTSDLERILDYLDGRLSTREMVEYEIRLTRDDELREAHESFERMDTLQRVALRRRNQLSAESGSQRSRSAWGKVILALVAASVALIAMRYGLDGSSGAPDVEVAVVASGATLLEHNVLLGLSGGDERTVPAGFGSRGDELAVVPDDDYLALVAGPTRARLEGALESGTDEQYAGNFVLAIRAVRDSWVVVLLFTEGGRAVGARGEPGRVAFPSEASWDAQSGFVDGGGVRVLPTENVIRVQGDASEHVEYRPGFLVPRRAGHLTVLVGLRSEALDDALRLEIESELGAFAASSADEAASYWRRRLEGFDLDTQVLEVIED